jgi:putative endonuclease
VYHVYILRSIKNNKLYIGHTNNLDRRIEDHNAGCGSKYTRQNGPWILVYSELHPDRASAARRERFLKSTRGSQEKKQLAGAQIKSLCS